MGINVSGGVDHQIEGTRDIGLPEGIKLAKIEEGQLVKLPFEQTQCTNTGTTSGWTRNFSENDDGSYTGFLFQPTAASLAGTYLAFWVYGRTVGLRWNAAYLANAKNLVDFSVMIDKVAYPVQALQIVPEFQVANVLTTDASSVMWILRDLPDGWHYVEVTIPTPPAGAAQAPWRFLGYVADRAAGYTDIPRLVAMQDPVFVVSTTQSAPTTFSSILDSGQTVIAFPRALRGIIYYNTDTVVQKVYVQVDPVATWLPIWEAVLQPAGTAGSVAVFPGEALGDMGVSQAYGRVGHYATATNVVRATFLKIY